MEDWQGCLDPTCQNALMQAKGEIESRGGIAITVEDFLLELLQVDKALAPFLSRCMVDQDELVRTVQCEQPLTPPPGEYGGLSSQLIYWFSLARDLCDTPWLSVADLLKVMVYDAERLSHKAYVAVLEKVGEVNFLRYRSGADAAASPSEFISRPRCLRLLSLERPFLVAVQTDWIESARDLLVGVGHGTGHIHCLWGDAGSGRTSLIRYAATLTETLRAGSLERAVFLELDVDALLSSTDPSGLLEVSADYLSCSDMDVCLVIDPGCSAFWAAQPELPWVRLLKAPELGVLMTETKPLLDGAPGRQWLSSLGMKVTQQAMPVTTVEQVLAVLRLHQSRLEREQGVVIRDDALRAAACLSVDADEAEPQASENGDLPAHPGRALALLEGAATRLQLWRSGGCAQLLALRDRLEDQRRYCLVQDARDGAGEPDPVLGQLGVEFAAYEADWMERRAVDDEVVLDRNAVVEERLRQDGVPLSRLVPRNKMRLVET